VRGVVSAAPTKGTSWRTPERDWNTIFAGRGRSGQPR
jgi:hypothetical protein